MNGETIKPNLNISRKVWGEVRRIATERGVVAEVVVEELLREGLAGRAGVQGDKTPTPPGRGTR